ncbi:MAG TPA: methyltransferase domain-containing protein [Allosphingosinicella sp.]|uniref:class I SAM-dependent methyltransferase n=1 Tax=Allosphingosinicella sp. TaxID=2823234 RepID=UPI002EDAFA60
MSNTRSYVHGYDPAESQRLEDQASTLETLLHHDTRYPAGGPVLEVGCGVGAQTVPLARNSPDARIVSVDISHASVRAAEEKVKAAGHTNVEFRQADIFNLPFSPAQFDHVFACFVLEHLPGPVEALRHLREVLKPGGSLTVIEGDHGSTYFHPDNAAARAAVHAQIRLQALAGGDANIGRRLYPLLREAGFPNVHVSPRMVYVDGSRPELADGFTERTFTAMIDGIRGPALDAGLIEAEVFEEGVRALRRTAEPDGVFCYTFFKATCLKPG